MSLIVGLLSTAIWLFLLLLIARMIIGLIMVFARDYQPTGAIVVIFESVMTVTDPPLRALRKVIPPLRIGQVSLDLAFLVLFIALQLLLGMLRGLA
ncbi:MAG: YggT family protein [Candidatus Nanopelagicales bacterium]|jgi:YggT family protein|nr:YggT family protein [Candidatus Nanopelagicales bacterium]